MSWKAKPALVLSVAVASCFAAYTVLTRSDIQQTEKGKSATKNNQFGAFAFTENSYNFGPIKNNKAVSHTFHFRNVGTAPLIIEDISTSCGCTAASWKKEPVPVNGTGAVILTFNKNQQPGFYNKTAIIKANIEDTYAAVRISLSVN